MSFGHRVATRQIGSFSFALTRYPAGAALPWHEHDDAYLTFVVDGEYTESLGGKTRDCDSRSVVFHPAGENHADKFGGRNAACLDVRFDSAWLSSIAERGCTIAHPALFTSTVVSRMLREFHNPDALSAVVVEGLLLELFVEKERTGKLRAAPAWLRSVRDMLASRTQSTSLSEIASVAGVHPTHLARAFRAHYGCTIGDFVRARRVEEAKQQLRTARPLADIALALGYSDQSHFTRTFRRVTGLTPAAYRKLAR